MAALSAVIACEMLTILLLAAVNVFPAVYMTPVAWAGHDLHFFERLLLCVPLVTVIYLVDMAWVSA